MAIFFFALDRPDQVTEVADPDGYVDSISMNPGGGRLLLAIRKENARGIESSRVYVLSTARGSLTQLTPDNDPWAGSPVFAHNASDIVFDEATGGIWQVTYPWANKRQLVADGEHPNIDSIGSSLIFVRQSNAGPFLRRVFTARPDGSGPQLVTPQGDIVFGPPVFNPADSSQILYHAVGVGIVSIQSNGSGRRVIVADSDAVEPRMRPDGQQLMFVSTSDQQIYVANANGSTPRRLTNHAGRQHRCPVYSPDGASVYFID